VPGRPVGVSGAWTGDGDDAEPVGEIGIADEAFGAVGFHAGVMLGAEPHDVCAAGVAVPGDRVEVVEPEPAGAFASRVAAVGVAAGQFAFECDGNGHAPVAVVDHRRGVVVLDDPGAGEHLLDGLFGDRDPFDVTGSDVGAGCVAVGVDHDERLRSLGGLHVGVVGAQIDERVGLAVRE